MTKASILVVEDDPAMRQGLLDVLVFNGLDAVGTADGADGLRQALAGRFDLVLLDVMLPSMDGFTVCREIRRKKPHQSIIMLTAKGAEDDIVTGFKAGADDYVTKPFSIRELLVRVQAVLRRAGKNLGDEEVTIAGIRFDGRQLIAGTGDQSVEITRREMDLMVYLFRHQNRIVTKKELLSQVWQYTDPDIETRTVDIHVAKLRKKIAQIQPRIEVILTVRGEGFRLSGDTTP